MKRSKSLWLAAFFCLAGAAWSSAEPLAKTVDGNYRRHRPQLEDLSWQDFGRRFAPRPYLEKLPFDPTSARYWRELNQAPPKKAETTPVVGGPADLAQKLGVEPDGKTAKGSFERQDLRLNKSEIACFKKNGFVVSERLGRSTMTGILYKIYAADLPIYVSADAILHAWHQCQDRALAWDERQVLAPQLVSALAATHKALMNLQGEDQQALRDVDLFLTVARSLGGGETTQSAWANSEAQVVLTQARRESQVRGELFGRSRFIDYSKLRPVGHYRDSDELRGYYRSVAWMSLCGWYLDGDQSWRRGAQAAITLGRAIKASGKETDWLAWQAALEVRVGPADGLSLRQLLKLLETRPNLTAEELRALLRKDDLGREYICSLEPRIEHPRRFSVAGEAYLADSYALSQCVYPNVVVKGQQVVRRIPSCLEVVFAVLGNDGATPYLVERGRPHPQSVRHSSDQEIEDLLRPGSDRDPLEKFRDGLPFQSNLAALRLAFDTGRPPDNTLTSLWLAALTELSKPPDPRSPSAMKTAAWADRLLNTQCASWAQLRRDFQLYLKESESGGISCEYPFGYVEPRPEFWKRMQDLAESQVRPGCHSQYLYSNFASTMKILREISQAELAGQPLSKSQSQFLRQMLETRPGHGCAGPSYDGWYFKLYGPGAIAPEEWHPTVTSAHNDLPDTVHGDPGGYLLEGTGGADLMVVAVDSGADKMIYLGPVLSHYEWFSSYRMDEQDWKSQVENRLPPNRPEWTRSFVVPGP